MESEQVYLGAAETLSRLMEGRDWFFKASFDKANRTSIVGARGPGLDEGLRLLAKAKELFPGIKLTTDVHEPWQVPIVAPLVDMIQVPAFLCRQTDLLVECARHSPIVNVKKGQWMSPWNIVKTVDKIKAVPGVQAWLTERGTPLGYDHLIVDATLVDMIRASDWDEFILDCTHSVQHSRHVYGTQGDRVLAKRYFLAAPILGYNGVFAETHPDPNNAISDGDCQIPLSEMAELIARQDALRETLR
jgi:2-dehydro-3-deoxyphosphooctonate aldolase (KDO 8-P synthase)